MKKAFLIEDEKIIEDMLNDLEYGTLAICFENKPYSVPLNFVSFKNEIYFHGSKGGKKMKIIKENSWASFCVVEALSLLPSYFSSDDGSACPATQFFKSIIIDGKIKIIDEYEEKVLVMQALMQKLQKEGKYIPLSDDMYKKALGATCVYKLIVSERTCKFKVGQNLSKDRYERVSHNLKQRATKKDLQTLSLLNKYAHNKVKN